jgi:hypothetical protein
MNAVRAICCAIGLPQDGHEVQAPYARQACYSKKPPKTPHRHDTADSVDSVSCRSIGVGMAPRACYVRHIGQNTVT